MGYDIVNGSGGTEIHFAGDLTFAAHRKFRSVVDRLRHARPARVALNLARVDYVDAAGLGLLLVVRDAVSGHGGMAELVGAEGDVNRLLEVSRFSELFAAT